MHELKKDLSFIKNYLQKTTGMMCTEIATCIDDSDYLTLEAVFLDTITDEVFLTCSSISFEDLDKITSEKELTEEMFAGIVFELNQQMVQTVTIH